MVSFKPLVIDSTAKVNDVSLDESRNTVKIKGTTIDFSKGVFTGGVYIREDKTDELMQDRFRNYIKRRRHHFIDLLLNIANAMFAIKKRPGVPQYRINELRSYFNHVKTTFKDDHEEPLCDIIIQHGGGGAVVFAPDLYLLPNLIAATYAQIKFRRLMDSDTKRFFGYPTYTIHDLFHIKDDVRFTYPSDSIDIILSARSALMIEEMYEMCACGLYSSIASHRRLHAVIKAINMSSDSFTARDIKPKERFTNLYSLLTDAKMPILAKFAREGFVENEKAEFEEDYRYRVSGPMKLLISEYIDDYLGRSSDNFIYYRGVKLWPRPDERLSGKERNLLVSIINLSNSGFTFRKSDNTSQQNLLAISVLGETAKELP